MGIKARKGYEMYDTEFWLWTIVPIINTIWFASFLLDVVTGKWKSSRWERLALLFTSTSFIATFVVVVTKWLLLAKKEPGYVVVPAGLFAVYTEVTAWVAGIGLLTLGLWKAYELLRSPKTDEKEE